MIILYELLSDNYRSKSWPDAFVDSLLVLQRTFRARSRLQDVLPGEGIGVIWASPHSIQLKGSL